MKWIVKYDLNTPAGEIHGSRPFNTQKEAIKYKKELERIYGKDAKVVIKILKK